MLKCLNSCMAVLDLLFLAQQEIRIGVGPEEVMHTQLAICEHLIGG